MYVRSQNKNHYVLLRTVECVILVVEIVEYGKPEKAQHTHQQNPSSPSASIRDDPLRGQKSTRTQAHTHSLSHTDSQLAGQSVHAVDNSTTVHAFSGWRRPREPRKLMIWWREQPKCACLFVFSCVAVPPTRFIGRSSPFFGRFPSRASRFAARVLV